MNIVWAVGSIVIAILLAGCATDPLGDAQLPAPEAGMAGRWMLAAPNAPTCGMNFAGARGAREGNVSPEGSCPGKFFMSRHWSLGQGGLTIVDEDSQPLATLSYANGRFEGQSTTGVPVTLTPPAAPPG